MKKLHRHLITNAGFSLVELSVVLAIIGVTLGGALTIATKKSEASKVEETNTKLNLIEHALERYVAINERLPCPADGSQVIDKTSDNTYGVEGEPSLNGCTNSNFNNGNTIYSGVVPVKTLGLEDEAMIDGWGRRISYVVDYHFTNNSTTNPACDGTNSTVCFQYTTTGTLHVNDGNGAARTSEAVYVLISHGKNGHGAFTYYGSNTRISFPTSQDSDEVDNSGSQPSYDLTFIQKSPTTTFDDIVRYKPKWQLINDANGILDTHVCIPAKNVVDHPDVQGGDAENSCSNASDVALCQTLAAKIHHLCWQ